MAGKRTNQGKEAAELIHAAQVKARWDAIDVCRGDEKKAMIGVQSAALHFWDSLMALNRAQIEAGKLGCFSTSPIPSHIVHAFRPGLDGGLEDWCTLDNFEGQTSTGATKGTDE